MKGLYLFALLILVCASRDVSALTSVEKEERNLEAVREFLAQTYDPVDLPSGDKLAPLLTDDCAYVSGSFPPTVNTCKMYLDMLGPLIAFAPDFNVTAIDTMFAKEDQAAVQFTVSGTHTVGEHNGIPPTNQTSVTPAIYIFDFDPDTGKIKKIYNEFSMFSMWTQLGWVSELCGCVPAEE